MDLHHGVDGVVDLVLGHAREAGEDAPHAPQQDEHPVELALLFLASGSGVDTKLLQVGIGRIAPLCAEKKAEGRELAQRVGRCSKWRTYVYLCLINKLLLQKCQRGWLWCNVNQLWELDLAAGA